MARKSTTAPTTENVVGVSDKEENVDSKPVIKKQVTLDDSEEIEVVSMIPNVSYLDKHTQDMYEWDEAGHSEYMTVETLKNMWKNNKGYFKNLWLKPLDDRVIAKFGLNKLYDDYEFLMDEKSYVKKNLERIVEAIENSPSSIQYSIVNKIKQLVTDGTISDVNILKTLGIKLGIDFIAFI